ncbi:AI-2E family transporter [Methylobacterium sp. 77]|uniref:AI-2E family transporter n=1 Tax=Methylobacterium sp. 77 TaxID=1101192 RepID=UPI00035C4AD2|nr:AI-2E family transporter [Methylobacterium sp. 77]
MATPTPAEIASQQAPPARSVSTREGVPPATPAYVSLPPPRATRVAAAEAIPPSLASPLIVTALIVSGLYIGRDVLIPIAIAVLLSFVLGPIVYLLRRLRFGRFLSVATSVIVALGVAAALATLIGVQLADLAKDVPRYRTTIEHKIEGLRDSPAGRMADYVANIGRTMHQGGEETAKPEAAKPEASGAKSNAPPPEKPVIVEMKERAPDPIALANTILSPILHPLATTGIVFIVLLFLLMQREDLRDRMIRLVGSSDLHRTTVAMDDAARRLSRYFLVQLALNAVFGIVIGICLSVIGVPNPALWGIFSALMRFIPYIGAAMAAVFPLALAAAVDPGWSMVISTLAVFLILEPLTGHVIEPMLYGQSTGMSPFAVLVSALFWTWLWGPVGLLLSTPLTVCLVVLGRHVDKLEFLDVLFGDRPALTPVENFYQRILADDPEEAQEHAELILKDCSLSAYYDDVVLKGLELAARDAARGVLTPDQKTDIRDTVAVLIAEMDRRDAEVPDDDFAAPDDIPADWKQDGAVLCVTGRSFVDESACAILAQLLNKRGIGTRIVPFADVARVQVDNFDPGPARMICIVSLAINGEPTHLRRLVGRLKRRMPDLPIVVGLWQADHEILSDEGQRAAIGADGHVSSLDAGLQAVLSRAGTAAPAVKPERSASEEPAIMPVSEAVAL